MTKLSALFLSVVQWIGSLTAPTLPALSEAPSLTKPYETFGRMAYEYEQGPRVLGQSTSRLSESSPGSKAEFVQQPTESYVSIALLGDSMTDTLGPSFDELERELHAYYPELKPTIVNYGVGGENILSGKKRITDPYTYLGRDIPSMASQQPDIVVIESFGYNPFPYDAGALESHWLALAQTIDLIRQHIPNAKIIIATTIAPNDEVFADGALGLNYTSDERKTKVKVIRSYLESTVRFALGQRLPLANAYHASLQEDNNGDPKYINPGDHIHPSEQGRQLYAEKIVEAIVENDLLL